MDICETFQFSSAEKPDAHKMKFAYGLELAGGLLNEHMSEKFKKLYNNYLNYRSEQHE